MELVGGVIISIAMLKTAVMIIYTLGLEINPK